MITIDEYIKHTDNLKEMGLLSEDFRIIQYKDGSCLGINGKSKAFEDKPIDYKDYIWWLNGYAFRYDDSAKNRPIIAIGNDGSLELRDAPLRSCFISTLCVDDSLLRRE